MTPSSIHPLSKAFLAKRAKAAEKDKGSKQEQGFSRKDAKTQKKDKARLWTLVSFATLQLGEKKKCCCVEWVFSSAFSASLREMPLICFFLRSS